MATGGTTVPGWARLVAAVAGGAIGMGIAWGSMTLRIAAAERRLDEQRALIEDQRQLIDAVRNQQTRIAENIAALCQATGARCR